MSHQNESQYTKEVVAHLYKIKLNNEKFKFKKTLICNAGLKQVINFLAKNHKDCLFHEDCSN